MNHHSFATPHLVLTLMDLKDNDDKKESINKMCKIYTAKRTSDGKSVLINNVLKNDIAFHLVNIMDLSDPSLLSSEKNKTLYYSILIRLLGL